MVCSGKHIFLSVFNKMTNFIINNKNGEIAGQKQLILLKLRIRLEIPCEVVCRNLQIINLKKM